MKKLVKSFVLIGGLGASLLAAGGAAHADLIPSLSVLPSFSSGSYVWDYDVELTNQQFLKSGAFFTIYDFKGYVPMSHSEPANWVFSRTLLGTTPSGETLTDDPLEYNLTWTYTGPTTGHGPTDLGHFIARSEFGDQGIGLYAGLGYKYHPGFKDNGLATMNKGPIDVPAPVVPEPCTLGLLGLGAAPLLRLRRRNRKA